MFKCGYAKKCITPPLGTPIVGYYIERLTKGVIDDLYVRATAFENGNQKAVILSVDVCLISRPLADELKQRIAQKCNMDADAVYIVATHTHSGPLLGKDFASDKVCPPSYEEFFKDMVCDAAQYAFMDLKPARFFTAQKEVKDISFIRRFKMKDGSVATNPGTGNPDIDYPLGEPDETMRLLKIVREGAGDILLVNYGTHTDTVSGGSVELISADFPGYLCDTLEKTVPGANAMFLLGPQGDVNHFDVHADHGGDKLINDNYGDTELDPAAHARHMGRCIAGAVLSVLAIAREIKTGEISFNKTEVHLPSHKENDKLEEAQKIADLYDAGRMDKIPLTGMALVTEIANARRIIHLKDAPDFFTYSMCTLKIGDMVFAGLPGEPFIEIGREIYEKTPFKNTIITCLTNDSGSYFPSSTAMSEGGYEASTCGTAAGSDKILIDEMVNLLEKLN